MYRRPPSSTRSDSLCPATTRFRSEDGVQATILDLGARGRRSLQLDPPVAVPGDVVAPRPILRCGAAVARDDPGLLAFDVLVHAGHPAVDLVRQQSLALLLHEVGPLAHRSEEHTSELQSLMRIPYDVFILQKKHDERSKEK